MFDNQFSHVRVLEVVCEFANFNCETARLSAGTTSFEAGGVMHNIRRTCYHCTILSEFKFLC